jgi:hypothetical protein
VDPKGYYSILGIPENATFQQIKMAYRETAMKYHPDKNKSPMASERMKKINEAYNVLSDEQKRYNYDHGKTVGNDFNARYYHYNANKNNKNYYYSSSSSAAGGTPQGEAGDVGSGGTSSGGRGGGWSRNPSDYFNFNFSDYSFKQNAASYFNKKVSVWWHMLYALIPLVNLWAFFRIQRLELAITSTFPLLVGIIVLVSTMPSYSYFPFRSEDRFSLFVMLFGIALVFFMGRWSIMWNRQIDKYGYAHGDKMDEKVRLVTQMFFSLIPFVNFSAFARICHFGKAIVVGVPTYLIMVGVATVIVQNSSMSFYPVYLALTSSVFLYFMHRWTVRYNSGKWDRSSDYWRRL